MAQYPCPCCGYLTFDELPGSLEICSICGWQDDDAGIRCPLTAEGPNRVSLLEAQRNFLQFGAMEIRHRNRNRPLSESDVRVPKWRPIDPSTDVPTGSGQKLYYWEKAD